MRKNLLLTSVLTLGFVSSVFAKQISADSAQDIASAFMQKQVSIQTKNLKGVNKIVKMKLAYAPQEESAYYVFNNSNAEGYVIVSGDDSVAEVLGYSDNGTFDYNAAPDGLKWLLGEYAKNIEYIQNNPTKKVEGLRVQNLGKSVEPLLGKIQWKQSSPFNDQCPMYTSNGVQKRSAVGCVATAMAQIMKHYEWPDKGVGSISYTYNGNQTVNQNFEHSYDWKNMLLKYNGSETDAQKKAVAVLSSDCGASVKMNYSSQSGAYSGLAAVAFVNNFKYSKRTTHLFRSSFTSEQWNSMLIAELDAGRPVLYAGQNSKVGHAFVFDGYNEKGYFHVNWGWAGMSDGYFLSTDLNPTDQGIGGSDEDYNDHQSAIFGLEPDKTGTSQYRYLLMCGVGMSSNVASIPLGRNFDLRLPGFLNISSVALESFSIYTALCDMDDNVVYRHKIRIFPKNGGSLKLDPDYSFDDHGVTYNISVPERTPVGKYRLKVVFKNKHIDMTDTDSYNQGKVSDYDEVLFPAGQAQYLDVEVKADGNAYISSPVVAPKLSVKSLEAKTKLINGSQAKVEAVMSNAENVDDFYGDLYVALFDESLNVKYRSNATKVDLRSGTTETLNFIIQPNIEGTYTMAVVKSNNTIIKNMTTVTIGAQEAAPKISATDRIVPKSKFMPADNIQGSFTVRNDGGYFYGNLQTYITSTVNGVYTLHTIINTEDVVLNNGDEVVVNFKGQVEDQPVGTSLTMQARDQNGKDLYKYAQFTVGVQPNLSRVKDITLPSTIMAFDKVYATAQVKNLSDEPYVGPIKAEIQYSTASGRYYPKKEITLDNVYFEPGETKTLKFSQVLTEGDIGKTYYFILLNPMSTTKGYWGERYAFKVGDELVSVNQIINDNGVQIYPNPATEYVTVEADEEISNVSVFSLSGVNVMNQAQVGGVKTVTLDVNSLPNGYYYVVVTTPNGTESHKFIKK